MIPEGHPIFFIFYSSVNEIMNKYINICIANKECIIAPFRTRKMND